MGTMATGRFLGDWLITKFGVKRILQISGILIAAGPAHRYIISLSRFSYRRLFAGRLWRFCVVPMVYGWQAGQQACLRVALAAVSTISFVGFLIGPPVWFYCTISRITLVFYINSRIGFRCIAAGNKIKRMIGSILRSDGFEPSGR